MYPTIELLGFKIYVFGVLLSITWLLFVTLLHHFSWREGFTRPIFSDRAIIYFTISMFFFARLWYLLAEWRDEQFILMELGDGNILEFAKLFFMPENYHFSLFGGVFGFLVVFFWKTREAPKERPRYFDAITWAFLYSAILGYVATLLGGQIYGIPFDSAFSILYDHKESIVELRSRVFPLPLFYLFFTGIIIITLMRFQRKVHELPHGFIGFLGLGLFCGMLFLGEFLNGSEDMFESYFFINLNQIGALIGILISLLGIFRNIEKKI